MANLTNSCSLTEFQRNAKTIIEEMNQTNEPLLITVNGRVQAVLVDPVSFREMERRQERDELLAAIAEGELDIQAGRVKPAIQALAELRAKHGL